MSNSGGGTGWWVASDGKSYPPELHPGRAAGQMPWNPYGPDMSNPTPHFDAVAHVSEQVATVAHRFTFIGYGVLIGLGFLSPFLMWIGLFLLAVSFAFRFFIKHWWMIIIAMLIVAIPVIGWIVALIFVVMRFGFIKANWSAISTGLFLYIVPPAVVATIWYQENPYGTASGVGHGLVVVLSMVIGGLAADFPHV